MFASSMSRVTRRTPQGGEEADAGALLGPALDVGGQVLFINSTLGLKTL